MKDDFYIGKYKWLVPAVVSILAVSIMMSKCTDNNLEKYQADSSPSAETITTAAEDNEDLTLPTEVSLAEYKDEEHSFSIEYPEEWVKAVNGEKVNFVDKASKATMSASFIRYTPEINLVNEEMVVGNIGADGLSNFIFSRTNNEYNLSYNKDGYRIYERALWDYDEILLLSAAAPEEYAGSEYFGYYLQNAKWESKNPIPENLYIKYYESVGFQLGFPGDWSYAESENSILSVNSNDTASINMIVNESTSDFSNVSQVDFVNELASSRSGFVLESYANNGTTISCTGTYTLDGKPAVVRRLAKAKGKYIFILTIDNLSSEEDISEIVMAVIASFKIF